MSRKIKLSGNSYFLRSFDEQRIGKIKGSKLTFKQEATVYIVQTEAMAVPVELFKRGNFFLRDTQCKFSAMLYLLLHRAPEARRCPGCSAVWLHDIPHIVERIESG